MSEQWYEKLIKYAKDIHEAYCDYPCFTSSDVLNFAVLRLAGVRFARQDGSSERTLFGDFGNVSYDHLLDAVYKAVEKLKEEAENTPL